MAPRVKTRSVLASHNSEYRVQALHLESVGVRCRLNCRSLAVYVAQECIWKIRPEAKGWIDCALETGLWYVSLGVSRALQPEPPQSYGFQEWGASMWFACLQMDARHLLLCGTLPPEQMIWFKAHSCSPHVKEQRFQTHSMRWSSASALPVDFRSGKQRSPDNSTWGCGMAAAGASSLPGGVQKEILSEGSGAERPSSVPAQLQNGFPSLERGGDEVHLSFIAWHDSREFHRAESFYFMLGRDDVNRGLDLGRVPIVDILCVGQALLPCSRVKWPSST